MARAAVRSSGARRRPVRTPSSRWGVDRCPSESNGSAHGHVPGARWRQAERRHRPAGSVHQRAPGRAAARRSLVVNVGCGVVRRFEPTCRAPLPGHRPPGAGQRRLRVRRHQHPPGRSTASTRCWRWSCSSTCPTPSAVLRELARVLKPGGTVIVSVPSAVPRHDDHDYWRFTAEGSGPARLGGRSARARCTSSVGPSRRWLPGRVLHRAGVPRGSGCPSRRFREFFPPSGYWLDRHNQWSSSTHRPPHAGLRPALRRPPPTESGH